MENDLCIRITLYLQSHKPVAIDESDVSNVKIVAGWDRSKYVTLTSSGIKKEGGAFLSWFNNREEAENAYMDELKKYVDGRKDCGPQNRLTLDWRRKPELIEYGGKYTVTSRLIVWNIAPYELSDNGEGWE